MSDTTAISWTGATWNPWQGCVKISPGCKNCYMYRDKARYGQDGRNIHRSAKATFDKPLKWQREVERGDRIGHDRLVFTCSWSDWFLEEADAWRDEAWAMIRACPDLVFQVLTKRAERVHDHLPAGFVAEYSNVWLGVSIEDQRNAEQRIPHMGGWQARIRFLSIEPMLAPMDLRKGIYAVGKQVVGTSLESLDWAILGGESGSAARPFDLAWARAVIAQCQAAGVLVYVKQLGANPVENGQRIKLGHPAGADPMEWPEDLRVLEMPEF